MRRQFALHAIALAALLAAASAQAAAPSKLAVHDGIGGDFTADSSLGRKRTE